MANEDPFSGPAAGVKITDYAGKLLLLTPTEYLAEVTTSFGEKDAVVADVVVLDSDEGSPEELDAVYLFQGNLIGATKSKVGKDKMVLGRLGQREPTKPGHSPAWVLDDPTDADKQTARDYLATKEPFA